MQPIQGGLTFSQWADGRDRPTSHDFLVGTTPVTYTAQYVNQPPVAVAVGQPARRRRAAGGAVHGLRLLRSGVHHAHLQLGLRRRRQLDAGRPGAHLRQPGHLHRHAHRHRPAQRRRRPQSRDRHRDAAGCAATATIDPGEACDGGACCTGGCQFAGAGGGLPPGGRRLRRGRDLHGLQRDVPGGRPGRQPAPCAVRRRVCATWRRPAPEPAPPARRTGSPAPAPCAGPPRAPATSRRPAPARAPLPGRCKAPNGTSCSDGNACNGVETCQSGTCAGERRWCATTATRAPTTTCNRRHRLRLPEQHGAVQRRRRLHQRSLHQRRVRQHVVVPGRPDLQRRPPAPARRRQVGTRSGRPIPTPAIVDGGDTVPVELGVEVPLRRRRASSPGFASTRARRNTGTHVGNLWSSTGTRLGDGDVHRRDGLGVAAGELLPPGADRRPTRSTSRRTSRRTATTAATSTTSLTQGVDKPPLHAPADGASGGNGVFAYGAASTLPDEHLPVAELLGRRGVQPAGDRAADVDRGDADRIRRWRSAGRSSSRPPGTYSDQSTQDLTSQVTWTSSSTGGCDDQRHGPRHGCEPGHDDDHRRARRAERDARPSRSSRRVA